jgi:hypothetical protein
MSRATATAAAITSNLFVSMEFPQSGDLVANPLAGDLSLELAKDRSTFQCFSRKAHAPFRYLIQSLNRAPSHVLTVKKRAIQGLRECVDLIVILADGKRHDFLSELIEP